MTTAELAYEGYVKFAEGAVISIQCFEGRCAECPDETPFNTEPTTDVLDGLPCEHACEHGPADQRTAPAVEAKP